jgi:hypothetical protein
VGDNVPVCCSREREADGVMYCCGQHPYS